VLTFVWRGGIPVTPAYVPFVSHSSTGALGRRFACGSAILGLYFGSFESLLFWQVDGRLPDPVVTAGAGGWIQRCVGAVFAERAAVWGQFSEASSPLGGAVPERHA